MTRTSNEPAFSSGAESVDQISIRALIRRASWPLIIKALPALYGAGLVLFVIRVLPPGEFGRYGIAFAFINLAAVFTRGMWAIPLVTWAARREEKDVLGEVFWLCLGSATLAGIIGLILLPHFDLSGKLAVMCAGMLLVLIPRELGYAMAQAHQRFKTCFTIELAYFGGSFVTFIILSSLNRLDTAVAALGANFSCAVLSSILAVIAYPVLIRPATHHNWARVWHFGKWIGGLGIGEVYFQQGDALLIGMFMTPAQIAPYLAARTLIRLYGVVSQAVNFIVLPAASRLVAAGMIEKLRLRVWQILSRLLIALAVLNLAIWIIAPGIFDLLFSGKYSDAVPFFRIIILTTFLEPVYIILGNALAGAGRPREVFLAVPLAFTLNVLLNLIFLPIIGLAAAAWTLVLSYAILALQLVLTSRRLLTPVVNPET